MKIDKSMIRFRSQILIILLLCANVAMAVETNIGSFDADPATFPLPHSEVAGEFFIAFRPPRSLRSQDSTRLPKGPRNMLFPSDAEMDYGLMCTNSRVYTIAVLAPEYGFDIWAVDDQGVPLEMTRRGARFGSELQSVKSYSRNQLGTGRRGRGLPQYMAFARKAPDFGMKFPAPRSLFKFPKPGTYTMYVRAQVWAYPNSGSVTNASLVRLPPVKLQILHRPDD